MRLFRLGKIFELKYKIAASKDVPEDVIPNPYSPVEPSINTKPPSYLPAVNFSIPSMADVDANIRNSLDILWKIPNQNFSIIRACADAGPSHPRDEHEKKAVEGAKFCRQVMSIVDTLKAKRDELSLSQIREGLESVHQLIQENRIHKEEDRSFPHVIALVFEMVPYGKKHDRRLRDQFYQKARKGFSRMDSVIIDILNYINKLTGKSEIGGRFDHETTALSIPEIEKFIRNYGDQYGIPDMETWSLVVETDPILFSYLTKLVHALERGKIPTEGSRIKSIIQNIIQRHQQQLQTNVSALEQEPKEFNPLDSSFENKKAWNRQMANKYNDLTLERYLNENR